MDTLPDAYIRKARAESMSGRLGTTHDAARIQRQLLWAVCACISLLSIRHLVIERNVHYPQRLYFNQLAVTGLMALRPCLGWGHVQRPFRRKLRPWRSMTKGTALIAASVCFMYVSTICFLQAVLHFYNLPVLVMITLITVCAEDMFLNMFRVTSATYAEMSRTCVVILATAGILIAEYRLNVPGLVTSILAMLFAGVARGFWKTAIVHHPDVLANNVNQASLHVMVGALVGVASAMIFGMNGNIFAFDAGNGFLLGLNALSTAMAMRLGKSMVLPMDDGAVNAASHSFDARVHRICDALTIAVLTGLAGCYSTLLTRRSYTNIYQLCCFWLAITCISGWPCARMTQTSLPNIRLAHDTNGLMRSTSWLVNSHIKPHWKYLAGFGIASLWISYGFLNFTQREESYKPASLDRTYVASIPVEIVVSMYKEPIEDVAKLIRNLKSMPALSDAYITIYIKDNGADNNRIKTQIQANQVITLPNIGREGETYLNHILNRWDSLAQQTIFLQAEIHNPREFYTRINNYYVRGRTGYLDLGWVGTVCNCDTCSDRLFWTDETHLIPRTYAQVYGSSSRCSYVLLSYKGQFAASAARIRGIDKSIYQGIWQALVDDKSWVHQDSFLHGRPDEMSAPDFGYTIERLWSMLLQCSSVDLAWKCPSLVSRWRIGGDVGDCQCFDT